MTLQQLKYIITVAETGTITEAANRLYISQPSLTNAIHELEKEMHIVIFNRTNKGITLSREGEDFLGYARQVLEQAAILEDKYKNGDGGKKQFCVSTQHYSFAVNAFVDLIKEYGQDAYDFSLRETQTYEIIEDVARMRSEIGILFLNDFNEAVLQKLLKSQDLEFHLLFVAKPHVFISRRHPLASKEVITNEELQQYPYLSFEQGEHNSFYFSEEIFSTSERKKNIRVRDRATLFNLLIGLNGYTVCSGVIDRELNGKDIIAAVSYTHLTQTFYYMNYMEQGRGPASACIGCKKCENCLLYTSWRTEAKTAISRPTPRSLFRKAWKAVWHIREPLRTPYSS